MRTTVRKIGNSRGILIPAPLLAECGIADEVEMRLDGARIVIEPVQPSRTGWFDHYRAEADTDAWGTLPVDADAGEWEW
ncbi:hypothetical protein GO613_03890 [Azoarcus communis]|uniref:SpoVT-AbrB domain-containing protein n=1 Tax=Parazoarcus communis SWub3 = DSM 12120 TaxID=1121029 RepID=A0A323VAG3_9RHOO|nr:AbrB/MazE/SpoVT family DNA-binding domain-containing protein [Parazoarcus communis]NMG47240.1 hypothetical protein [Parazoarcus communis]NMG71775.1 hypothetical protein [Parazoarcus communis SWub3 = DSM 12120]PZA17258.1 hypothetical protein DNK49_08510 [Azoarcus communis] [Parazoarcus communis SWub3 = DSM 12120]